MKTSIIKIGNSKGVVLPANILRKSRLSLKSSVIVGCEDDGSIVIKPTPREGWEEFAKKMTKASDDKLLVNDIFSDDDLNYWTWDEK
jgi:antitoxin MazE